MEGGTRGASFERIAKRLSEKEVPECRHYEKSRLKSRLFVARRAGPYTCRIILR